MYHRDLPDEGDFDGWAAVRIRHKLADGEPVASPDALVRKLASDWASHPGDRELEATRRRARAEAMGGAAEERREASRRAEAERRAAARVTHARGCRCDRRGPGACPELPELTLPRYQLDALAGRAPAIPRDQADELDRRGAARKAWLELAEPLDLERWAGAVGGELADRVDQLRRYAPEEHARIVEGVRERVRGSLEPRARYRGMADTFERLGDLAWSSPTVKERAQSLYEWEIVRATTAQGGMGR